MGDIATSFRDTQHMRPFIRLMKCNDGYRTTAKFDATGLRDDVELAYGHEALMSHASPERPLRALFA